MRSPRSRPAERDDALWGRCRGTLTTSATHGWRGRSGGGVISGAGRSCQCRRLAPVVMGGVLVARADRRPRHKVFVHQTVPCSARPQRQAVPRGSDLPGRGGVLSPSQGLKVLVPWPVDRAAPHARDAQYRHRGSSRLARMTPQPCARRRLTRTDAGRRPSARNPWVQGSSPWRPTDEYPSAGQPSTRVIGRSAERDRFGHWRRKPPRQP